MFSFLTYHPFTTTHLHLLVEHCFLGVGEGRGEGEGQLRMDHLQFCYVIVLCAHVTVKTDVYIPFEKSWLVVYVLLQLGKININVVGHQNLAFH